MIYQVSAQDGVDAVFDLSAHLDERRPVGKASAQKLCLFIGHPDFRQIVCAQQVSKDFCVDFVRFEPVCCDKACDGGMAEVDVGCVSFDDGCDGIGA